MTVLFFGVLGSVSFLTVWSVYWIYRHLPDRWLCDYGEEPGEKHLPENRCLYPKRAMGMLAAMIFAVLFVLIRRDLMRLTFGSDYLDFSGSFFQTEWISSILTIPFGELMNGIMFLILEILYLLLISMILFPAVLSDLDYCIIPDQTCFAAAAAALLRGFAEAGFSGIGEGVKGALLCGVMMWISTGLPSILMKRETLGMGDLKLLGACGAVAAVSAGEGSASVAAISVFSGTVLLSAAWFSLLLLFQKTEYGDERPMAPWIVFSTLLSTAWF